MPIVDWLDSICNVANTGQLFITHHVKQRQLEEGRLRPTTRQINELCSRDRGVVEDCPDDSRGPEGLLWGVVRARIIHVRCTYERADPPFHKVISSYWADTHAWKWATDFKSRLPS